MPRCCSNATVTPVAGWVSSWSVPVQRTLNSPDQANHEPNESASINRFIRVPNYMRRRHDEARFQNAFEDHQLIEFQLADQERPCSSCCWAHLLLYIARRQQPVKARSAHNE